MHLDLPDWYKGRTYQYGPEFCDICQDQSWDGVRADEDRASAIVGRLVGCLKMVTWCSFFTKTGYETSVWLRRGALGVVDARRAPFGESES